MRDKQAFYDALEELVLKRGDWFLARNLVKPLEKKLGEPVSPVTVGWCLSKMSHRLLLESRYIAKAPLERIKEYRTIKWDPNL